MVLSESAVVPTSSLFVQTTASDAALTAIVAARSRYINGHPGTILESLVIYVTTQTHSFGKKAAMILGLRVRALDVDGTVVADNTGLTGETLRAAVEEDHAQELHPFVLSKYDTASISGDLTGRDVHNSWYSWDNIIGCHRSSG